MVPCMATNNLTDTLVLQFCEDAEDILLPRKSDFLKLALRVVQFQQVQEGRRLGLLLRVRYRLSLADSG